MQETKAKAVIEEGLHTYIVSGCMEIVISKLVIHLLVDKSSQKVVD